ncbi:MAG TPA: hypothetical protein VGH28_25155 [Polyangiaceae bacterium]|jgi:tetratricopeptide (TPR) repeat protein
MRRALVASAFLLASVAHAEPPRATAVELFAHGRALAASGKCAEAIPFFLDTLKIEPSIGALLNLAECREKLGDHASAYASYRDAETLARREHDDRAELARDRAATEAAFLPRIAIAAPAGVRVTIDDRDASDVAVVAPGEHVVRATEAGHDDWRAKVRAEGTATVRVVVPELHENAIAPTPRAPSHTQRTAGVALMLAGIATLAAAGALGGVAIAKKNDAAALATGPSEPDFEAARGTAASIADASTATFIVGAVLVAAGAVVWLTAPRVAIAPGPTAFGASLVVRF